MKILIVEDDASIASFLMRGLAAEGYEVSEAQTLGNAEELLHQTPFSFDLVLLDLMLPDGDGISYLEELKDVRPNIPVIVLTAKDRVRDKVAGFEAGASDYLTKPFHFDELLARIRARTRQSDSQVATEIEVGDIKLDYIAKTVWRAGEKINLTPREFALLEILMRHPTETLPRSRLLSRVWEYDFDPGTNVLDVYIGYLRKKLNARGSVKVIETVRGIGYRFLPSNGSPG